MPQQRSAEGILEDSLDGRFGEPSRGSSSTGEASRTLERSGPQVRVDRVVIRNFRAYRKEQTFKLGEAITILYGPNGFGKTSFFDAVDFAATGEVGRIDIKGETSFRRVARHLDGEGEASDVTFIVESGGSTRALRRSVGDRMKARLDGHVVDRKTVLAELTNSTFSSADRVDNLVRLFRATHLFSQGSPELAKDFARHSELSEPIVSRLLALEDYTSAVEKAKAVRNVARQVIGRAEAQRRSLADELAATERELERLNKDYSEHVAPRSLERLAATFLSKLRDAQIEVEVGEPTIENVRSWRGAVEARRAVVSRRRERLEELSVELGELEEIRSQRGHQTKELLVAEKEELRLSAQAKTLEEKMVQLKQYSAGEAEKLQRARRQLETLRWAWAERPRYREANKRLKSLDDALPLLRARANELSDSVPELEGQLAVLQQQAEENAKLLVVATEALDGLKKLRWRLRSSRNPQKAVVAAQEAEEQTAKALEALRAQEREWRERLEAEQNRQSRLLHEVERLDLEHSALRKLLLAIREQVEGPMCPVCGLEHETEQHLLARIDSTLGPDTPSDQLNKLDIVRGELSSLIRRKEEYAQALARAAASHGEAEKRRAKAEGELNEFRRGLFEIGLTLRKSPEDTTSLRHLGSEFKLPLASPQVG